MAGDGFLTAPDKRPQGGQVIWTKTSDGVGLRIAVWPRQDALGTVLIFSGRTEYIEKYGPGALDLAERGFATATLDWRGQGLSDRLLPDRNLGHVEKFVDYQRDVAAFVEAVKASELPRPYFLLAQSMGGAIGLRSLLNGLDVSAAAFAGPMWGLFLPPWTRAYAWSVGTAAHLAGFAHLGAPGADKDNYVSTAPFDGNVLTSDPQMYAYLAETLVENPDLGVGQPTCAWVYQALLECRALARANLPEVPAFIALGREETVVDPRAVERRVARWSSADLQVYDGRHEIMIETPDVRADFYDRCAELFLRHR